MVATCFVAKALVLDADGLLLRLTRSNSHPFLGGLYDLPGGMVEPGEEPGEALIREIKEETSILIEPGQPQVLYATTHFLHGSSYPTLLYLIQLNQKQPAVTVSYEHQAADWVTIDALADIEPHIAPTYREALHYLREHKIIGI